MATITRDGDNLAFKCDADDTILRAALRAGLGMPYSCNVGSCGNCKFQLIEGQVEHVHDSPPAWSDRDVQRGRWLGCQARPLGDCTVKFREDPAFICRNRPEKQVGELVAIRAITRDIKEFSIRVPGVDHFIPGQYALISAPGIRGGRAYSMSNLPGEGVWSFMIKRVPGGAVTQHLFERAQAGDTLQLDGPFGTAWLRAESERDLVLAAGGSGLSPMVSIARGAFEAGLLQHRTMHFFYGARTQADLVDPQDVLGAELGAAVVFHAALSNPDTAWTGLTGLLPDVVAASLGEALAEHEFYFAGPGPMAAAMQKIAYERGLVPDHMHFDEFY